VGAPKLARNLKQKWSKQLVFLAYRHSESQDDNILNQLASEANLQIVFLQVLS
jgi:protoheme ferro-lyase